MITLTAQMRIQGENPLPFSLGVSELGGGALFGTTIEDEVKFDRRNLISLESEVKDRADIDKPSFGIISTGGSLSFKDNSSRFFNYANAGLLTEGIEIKIFLENTVKKTKKQVGQYYTTDWDYDNDNRSVSVSFSDGLENLQDKNSHKIEVSPEESPKSIFHIYDGIYKPSDMKILLDANSQSIMQKTESTNLYKSESNIWSDLNKICEICGLHIYNDFYGNTRISAEFDLR